MLNGVGGVYYLRGGIKSVYPYKDTPACQTSPHMIDGFSPFPNLKNKR